VTVLVVAVHAAALAVFLARERWLAGTAGFPLDDAWIHLHFARHLAEGQGFAYNPGQPVAGSTGPLWTALLGGLFALAGSQPRLAKLAGVLAGAAAAVAAGRLTRAWTGDRVLAAGAGALAALAGPLAWGSLSGMEVSLAALLVTAALLAHARGRAAAAAVMVGLAALARPEALLLGPLLWAAGPLSPGRALVWTVALGVVLGPWVGFSLATTGTPLPATAAAKVEGGLVGYLLGVREPLAQALLVRPWRFLADHAAWLWSVDVLLPVLLLPGLWLLARRHGRAAALPASLLLLHPLGMALLAPYRPPSFQEGRYGIHLLPLAAAVAMAGLAALPGSRLRRAGTGLVLAAALAVLWPAAGRYARAVENIESMQVRLGRWVERHTPREARLALNDVGAIAYLSRRQVVDLMGLVTPAILPARRDGEAGLVGFLERACPDYLVVFPRWFPELVARTDLFTPLERVRLAHNTVAGADEMVVYLTAWNRWQPAPRPCGGGGPRAAGAPGPGAAV
jgi:hypothetical protein